MADKNYKKVRKAVIAAAGFGTRFLPQTKAMPKEMLPLVDKPIIQYIVEELVDAGIEDIIIVTGYHKRTIEDHFDQPNQDLLANLSAGGAKKQTQISQVNDIANMANFAYIRQKGPYGSTTPIANASHLIGDEPFIYTFADDLILGTPNHFKQMIALYEELGGAILPCIELTKDEEYERYGVIAGERVRDDVIKMSQLVEKPGKANAPSNFASVGGYLLTPEIFPYIERAWEGFSGEELYITTYVLDPMIQDGQELYACKMKNSKYHDTGNKLEYLKTVVDCALNTDDIKEDFRTYLESLIRQ